MNKIEKNEELATYYLLYHPLLKEEKQNIFEMYYDDDYSINEIAEINQVSKNAIYNTLVNIEKTLYAYEDKLHLIKKQAYLNKQLEQYDLNLDKLMEGYDE